MAERKTQSGDAAAEQNGGAGEEDPARKPSPLKNPRVRVVLLVVVLVAIAGGLMWYLRYSSYGRYQQSTNDAFIQSNAVVVSSKVSGYVERVLVADNQQVRAGQALVEIDPRDYRARAEQYQAQVNVAQANAAGVQAQVREQAATIDQARAQLKAAESSLAFAHGEVVRFTPLAASGAETHERLAQLRDQEKQAAAQVATARASVTGAERRVGSLEAQIGQARAQGKAAEAQLASANVDLGYAVIRASSDGQVGNKTVQPGQFVQPGVRLMSIVPVHNLYINANFKETQLGLMRVGQPVRVKVDAIEGVELHGHVESIAPGTGAQFSLLPPQNATGNFTKIVQRIPVRVAIDPGPEARRLLVPGMSVEVTVDTRSARGAREVIEREQRDSEAARK